MPKIDDEDTQTALISFQFDAKCINVSDVYPSRQKFKIYPNPEVLPVDSLYLHEGDPLILEVGLSVINDP